MARTGDNSSLGIVFILLGMLAISVNDMLFKFLSGDYPLHQLVFVRSSLGILVSLALVQLEGGLRILLTDQPWLHALRAVLLVTANLTYFTALAALPLADATALFFIAPLLITLLSIPLLGEAVGPRRLTAVMVGFAGAVIMQRPWLGSEALGAPRILLLLPLIAALTYALNQVLTRKLGAKSKASAMAVYIQFGFILFSSVFYLIAGDGRFADGVENPSALFLLRAWVWPAEGDIWIFLGLGGLSAVVGYCLSQAYRIADAATVAPFEYLGLPLAVLWGFVIFGELPVLAVWLGTLLILGGGLFVMYRERRIAA